ncbi:MAG: methyltransferase domain-containing protein [Candidatus Longimicrobiales bacterium M2_2A_002]
MTLLDRAVDAPERMDAADVDRVDLERALDHIVVVNRWLGARRALRKHLPWALPAGRTHARVLDIGTGSGDLAVAMAQWGREQRRTLRVTAVDLHAATLRIARERTREVGAVRLVQGDGLRLPFHDAAFDLAHLSMTLHHMDGPALVDLLRETGRVARDGRVLVGELERALPNYLGARLLAATLWRSNPITRHDGPLSVRRSFTPSELARLARDAGLRSPSVHRHPFYRLVLRAEA